MNAISKEIKDISNNGINNSISVRVVSSLDEMQMVVAVRSCVFLGKPGWGYAHTFDPNDHCATHILGFVGDEPAGTIRVRWFAEFARIERLAIRPEFRSMALLNRLANLAMRICYSKGYAKAAGLAYPQVVPFWVRKGGRAAGEPMDSEYGSVTAVVLDIPKYAGAPVPPTLKDAGLPEFEWSVYEWEGAAQ